MAFNLASRTVLYGRYWGGAEHFPFLHFNVALYHSIDQCLARGRLRFEGGAGGEHKLSRGFEPAETWSCHALSDPAARRGGAAAPGDRAAGPARRRGGLARGAPAPRRVRARAAGALAAWPSGAAASRAQRGAAGTGRPGPGPRRAARSTPSGPSAGPTTESERSTASSRAGSSGTSCSNRSVPKRPRPAQEKKRPSGSGRRPCLRVGGRQQAGQRRHEGGLGEAGLDDRDGAARAQQPGRLAPGPRRVGPVEGVGQHHQVEGAVRQAGRLGRGLHRRQPRRRGPERGQHGPRRLDRRAPRSPASASATESSPVPAPRSATRAPGPPASAATRSTSAAG